LLFQHTGGTLGMYEKDAQLVPLLRPGQVQRLSLLP
jgi:hypothetical protein